jgi:hypothetical protein
MHHLYAENLTHIKIGMQFCVDFKQMKASQFITEACVVNTHPNLHKCSAMSEILNRQKSKIQSYVSQRNDNSFFYVFGILNSWLNIYFWVDVWNRFLRGKCLLSALFQPSNCAGTSKYIIIPRGFGNGHIFYKNMNKCEIELWFNFCETHNSESMLFCVFKPHLHKHENKMWALKRRASIIIF